MKYRDYSFQDFVGDAYFQQWVHRPDDACRHFWENWLAQHPEKQADVDQARQILLSVSFKHYALSSQEKDEVWTQIVHRNENSREPASLHRKASRTPHRRIFRWGAAVAASLSVLFLMYAYSWWIPSGDVVYTADYGKTRTIILSDQSTVELNANSSLRVSQNGSLRREVWLEGEAFFEVQPRRTTLGQRIPFLVHTHELVVSVIGTKFNVLSRRGETQVGLSSGKVKLQLPTQDTAQVDMQPGDWVAFSQASQQLKKSQLAPASYTVWRQKRLLFDGHTLSQVGTMMEDYYGYDVAFSDPGLAERTFSGQFPADRVDLLLEAIQAVLEVKIEKTDHKITITQH